MGPARLFNSSVNSYSALLKVKGRRDAANLGSADPSESDQIQDRRRDRTSTRPGHRRRSEATLRFALCRLVQRRPALHHRETRSDSWKSQVAEKYFEELRSSSLPRRGRLPPQPNKVGCLPTG